MSQVPRIIGKLSQRRRRILDLAKRAAMESTYGKLRHGAVVVKGGSIISFGFNKDSHILGLPRSATEGADLYVVRINNKCQWRMSKPCPMCEQVLKFVGVRRVFYTIDGKHYDCYRL